MASSMTVTPCQPLNEHIRIFISPMRELQSVSLEGICNVHLHQSLFDMSEMNCPDSILMP